MKTITYQNLVDMLLTEKKSTIVTLICRTIPKMNKGDNPFFGQIFKWTKVNGILNWDYEKSVSSQRLREGLDTWSGFKALDRTWGKHLTKSLIEHKGRLYVQIKVEKTIYSKYYHFNKQIDKSVIEKFLVKSYQPKTQETEKAIVCRNYALDSIKFLVLNGTYRIVDSIPIKNFVNPTNTFILPNKLRQGMMELQ